jgi:hypothetical protein
MRLASLTVLISLSGCKQETAEPISLVAIQGDEPISIQLHDAVGSGSVHVPIRQAPFQAEKFHSTPTGMATFT